MRKIFNLFRWRRARLEQDLDRELRYHVDRRVQLTQRRRRVRCLACRPCSSLRPATGRARR